MDKTMKCKSHFIHSPDGKTYCRFSDLPKEDDLIDYSTSVCATDAVMEKNGYALCQFHFDLIPNGPVKELYVFVEK